ncbi:hypothetical protein B0H16DRAFT_1518754 [Mycena metata]|uniref:Uncharacterized protein n=1 Tax=Mycena metata TaxID=1033252 RepID=A0AAD7NP01_9AGAR|nr:hypothetical protein B0H16DRAFT_1518754 [Mycena metata]
MGTAPPPRKVVVDDTDSAIQYGAVGWFPADPSGLQHGNFGPIYNGTTSGASSNANFTFHFTGSSILVQGSIIVTTDANNVTDPSWTCTVDGIAIPNPKPTFQFPENNWPLCQQDTITLGQHVLTVKVTSKGQPFYFDSLIYTPAPDAVFESAVLLYPDGDPALTYSPGWKKDGEQVAQTANMQVTLNFYGTSATLYSQIPSHYPPNATTGRYILDGEAPITFPLNGLAGATDTQFNIPTLTTPTLVAGAHNLTVIYDGDINHTPLAVKQFLVTNTTTSSSSVPASVPFTSPSPTGPAKSHSSLNKGVIAGAVVAAVLVVALLVGIYFLRIRRRRRRDMDEMSTSTSYPVTIGAAPAGSYYAASSSHSSSKHTRSATSSDALSVPQLTAHAKSRPVAPPTVVLQHEDSGVRRGGPSAEPLVTPIVVELPPGYSLA